MKKRPQKIPAKDAKESKTDKLILALHKDLNEKFTGVYDEFGEMKHRFSRVDSSILDLQTDVTQIKEDVRSIKNRVNRIEIHEEISEERLKKVEAKV